MHNDLIKDFNIFMYNHKLHRGGKHFCRYCLPAFITGRKYLKFMLMIALRLMVNKLLRCLKKLNMLNSKIMKEK